MIPDDIVLIVRASLNENPGRVQVDVGSLAPVVAAMVLQAAADALDIQPEPPVTVVFNDAVVAVTEPVVWEFDDDDD